MTPFVAVDFNPIRKIYNDARQMPHKTPGRIPKSQVSIQYLRNKNTATQMKLTQTERILSI